MRLNKGFGLFNFSGNCLLDLNNFKRFSFWPWMWRFPAMFCHAGPSSLAFLAGQIDSDIQISKNGLQRKLKLHQLWRIAMWLSHDCSWILTAACFSGDNVSLWTGVHSSSLGDNSWISLTALRLFCYSLFVIRQDCGFGSPREPHQLPGWLTLLSCFYKSNS